MKLFGLIPPRLCPQRAFPLYAFIPGKNIHPNKPGGHSFECKEVIAAELIENEPWQSEELGFALDLYHAGYFWESHVYLEAIWNAHGRKGEIAEFMKALIKLAAAGVKFELGQDEAAWGHLERALELLLALKPELIGIDVAALIKEVDEILSHKSVRLPLVTPNWPRV